MVFGYFILPYGKSLSIPFCQVSNFILQSAEENIMDLMKENEENKRWMILSVICAVITVIAVCALVVIAACLEMPAAVRVALVIFI